MTLAIPDRLVQAILFVRGEENGRAWLRALPRRIDLYLRRWNLTPLEIAEGGAMSCCIFCETADGTEAVLKIPFDAASGRLESRSLARWGVSGASPAVLATAPSSGVFLMSRVRPGTVALTTGAERDSEQLFELLERMTSRSLGQLSGLKRLDRTITTRFGWAHERFRDPGYDMQIALMPSVEQLARRLECTTDNRAIVHGDLQMKNILIGADGSWALIDPMTCLGDLNADAALWTIVQDDGSSIEQRVDELSQSDLLDRTRLEAWCFVLGIAEYRLYQPTIAARIDEFLAQRDCEELTKRFA